MYKECGLPNVALVGLKPHCCPTCKQQLVEVPSVNALHKLITKCLILKRVSLTGAELRFLRKTLQLSVGDFAGQLGITPNTLLSWEQSQSLRYRNDLIVRMVVAALLDHDENLRIGDVVTALNYRSPIDRKIRIRWMREKKQWVPAADNSIKLDARVKLKAVSSQAA